MLYVAIVMVRRGGSWGSHAYTSGAIEVVALCALVLDILPAIAWWTLKKGKPSARGWALAASLSNFPLPIPGLGDLRSWSLLARSFHIPVEILGAAIGVAGLVAFSRRQVGPPAADQPRPQPLRLPGDGTSKWADSIAWIVGVGWIFLPAGGGVDGEPPEACRNRDSSPGWRSSNWQSFSRRWVMSWATSSRAGCRT